MELIETKLIPYEATALFGERLLVLAPHPDDEVIGCGGLIALHRQAGCQVRVVIATDGAAQLADDATRESREAESIAALAHLGAREPRFLRLPDRGLADATEPLSRAIAEELAGFRPDLIVCPAPTEIHPDHVALARAFVELIQESSDTASQLAVARIAFCEISRPLNPNVLVDITTVAQLKFEAIAHHETQTAVRDYVSFARGLNEYRAMTLAAGTQYAEAFTLLDAAAVRTLPMSEIERRTGGAPTLSVERERPPIAVIVRTKNRPQLLREALESIAANSLAAEEVVVVNDGGQSVAAICSELGARLIENELSAGRSEAMNQGVRAATAPFIAFLDDDDLYYPEHLETLATASQTAPAAAWYTDAVSNFLRLDESGGWKSTQRLRIFDRDFDRETLLVDNFIPTPSLLVRRSDYLDLGGFDPKFDLFEDWDFLIRLSRSGRFIRVPRVTCEIRHFAGGESAILDSPEGSATFRTARMEVWRKHSNEMTHELFASAWEKEKLRRQASSATAVEAVGRAALLEREIARLTRERDNADATRDWAQREAGRLNDALASSEEQNAALRGAIAAIEQDLVAQSRRSDALDREITAREERIAAYISEVERLNRLLDMIYASKTWKLHSTLERLRGRRD